VKRFVFLMVAFGMLLSAPQGWAQGLIGNWQGTLDVPQKLRAVLTISAAADGQLRADFFSIDQSPNAMSVQDLTLNASTVTFKIPTVQGSYEGRLSADGAAINGVWTQGGSHALNFLRATKEAAWKLDPSPHTARFITVEPGVKLEVLDWGGTGRPLVLLAGLGNSAHAFDHFAPKLTGNYHVYAISRRGYGASDTPKPADENYSADRLGEDVIAILDELKLVKPVLVGHSIAGEELSSIGSRHPDRVAGLVYLDAGYSYAFYDRARPEFQMDLSDLRRKLNAIAHAISPQEQRMLLADVARELPQFEKDVQRRQAEIATRPDMSAEDIRKAKAQMGSREAITGDAVFSGIQPYTKINCPVLAIFAVPHQRGSKPDAEADAKDVAAVEPQVKSFQVGVPQATVVRIAHANHYVYSSNEADVIREINTFVAKLK